MREIVLDTETTGLKARGGDRVVEIGCVELLNHIPTGNHWHQYINPERDMPNEAFQIHGLSEDFLRGHGVFADIADSFMDFIGDARLVIHNASFDIGFLNAELERLGHDPIASNRVVDTLDMARRRHPGAQNSLDALCSRYGIDNSRRDLHGALLDSELLAEVYIELIGGRQSGFSFGAKGASGSKTGAAQKVRQRPEPLPSSLSDADLEAHRAFVRTLNSDPLWAKYDATYAPGTIESE